MLPGLTPARREKLAYLLLVRLEMKEGVDFYHFHRPFLGFVLWVVSQCAPNVNDREGYLRGREAARERNRYYDPFDTPDLILTALYVERRGKRCSSQELLRLLCGSVRWAICKDGLLCGLAGGIMFFFIPASPVFLGLYVGLLAIIPFLSQNLRSISWVRRRIYFGPGQGIHVTLMLMLASGLVASMFALEKQFVLNARFSQLAHFGVVFLVTLVGIAIRGEWTVLESAGSEERKSTDTVKLWLYRVAPIVFAILVVLTGLSQMFLNLPAWWAYVTNSVAFTLIGLSLYLLSQTLYSSRIVRKASNAVATAISGFGSK